MDPPRNIYSGGPVIRTRDGFIWGCTRCHGAIEYETNWAWKVVKCCFLLFFAKNAKNAYVRIDIATVPLYARTSSENEKNAPWRDAFFSFNERVRAYNGTVAIWIPVEAVLYLFLWHFWTTLLNTSYKHAYYYMIASLRVPLIFTSHFYIYQGLFLSKKLNHEKKLTGKP